MKKQRRRKTRSITVIGRRWFDTRAGNTYFSCQILVNGELVHTIDYEYGYGDQFEQEAFTWLDENGYTKREKYAFGGSETPSLYCRNAAIAYFCTVADVARKKDL